MGQSSTLRSGLNIQCITILGGVYFARLQHRIVFNHLGFSAVDLGLVYSILASQLEGAITHLGEQTTLHIYTKLRKCKTGCNVQTRIGVIFGLCS